MLDLSEHRRKSCNHSLGTDLMVEMCYHADAAPEMGAAGVMASRV